MISVIHTDTSAPEQLSSSELEIVSHTIVKWETLALHLNVSEEKVTEIKAANKLEGDCCRRLLKAAVVEREKMIDILEDMEYTALANSLMCDRVIVT